LTDRLKFVTDKMMEAVVPLVTLTPQEKKTDSAEAP
jgi:hypothetical protein